MASYAPPSSGNENTEFISFSADGFRDANTPNVPLKDFFSTQKRINDLGSNVATIGGSVSTLTGSVSTLTQSVSTTSASVNSLANSDSVEMGNHASALGLNSISIGKNASTFNNNSVSIGIGATSNADNQINLGTATEKVVVKGAVGIQNDAPTAPLHIKQPSGENTPQVLLESADNTDSTQIRLKNGSGSREITLTAHGAGVSGKQNQFIIRDEGVGVNRFVITQGGEIGINTPTGSLLGKLDVRGNVYAGGNLRTSGEYTHTGKHLVKGTWNSSSQEVIWQVISSNGSDRLRIKGNGELRLRGSVIHSDDRLKTDEVYITDATNTLMKLKPQNYNKYNDTDCSGFSTFESGLIAQEMFYDAPELRHLVSVPDSLQDASGNPLVADHIETSDDPSVDPDYSSWDSGDKNDFASVNYMGLIPYLIKSNQEQQEQINILTARLNALE